MKLIAKPCPETNWSYTRNSKRGVFIHWSVGTQSSCDATFANPGRYASTHYSIEEDEVHQYVSEDCSSYHCGASQNYTHLSIELAGWPGHPPTDGTMQTCAELIADMSRRYGWGRLVHTYMDDPDCNVWEHNWVYATSCPGETDVDEIVRRANIILGYEEGEDMNPGEVWAFSNPLCGDTKDMRQRIVDIEQKIDFIGAKVDQVSCGGVDYDKLADAVVDRLSARLKD